MRLHNLPAPEGANKRNKRVGRGESSGHGKTAGRGGKGQTARTGKGKPGRGFEGGQMPMYRRMPKRGFAKPFAKLWVEVNVDTLAKIFPSGASVDFDALLKVGLATKKADGFRVIGRGDLTHALTITANHFSASAKEKIEKAGGKMVVIEPRAKYVRPSAAAGASA
jgi:large subunit ribosomal protein L15